MQKVTTSKPRVVCNLSWVKIMPTIMQFLAKKNLDLLQFGTFCGASFVICLAIFLINCLVCQLIVLLLGDLRGFLG